MKARCRKILILLLGSAVVLVVLPLVIWRLGVTKANNRTIEAIRRSGIPTSRVELDAWYAAVPADKNAALVLAEAMEALQVRPAELQKMRLLDRGERLTNAAVVKAFVETNRAALDLSKTALERPQCRYFVNLLLGPDANMQHLEHLRKLGQLADYAALLAAERGAGGELAEHIATIIGLARTLEAEPVLLSQLVRIAMLNLAARRFERSLSLTRFSEPDLARLAWVFTDAMNTNGITRAMIGERARMISIFRGGRREWSRLMSAGGATPQRPGADELLFFPLLRITGFLERDLRFYLESMDKIIAQSRLGAPQSLHAIDTVEDYAERARRKYCVLTAISLPAVSRVFSREAESLALLRMAALACAIEQSRSADGSLPHGLADWRTDFVAQVASDPCDGRPLRYRRLDDGYLIYSVGADRRDDNGTEPERPARTTNKGPEDLVFRVRTPK